MLTNRMITAQRQTEVAILYDLLHILREFSIAAHHVGVVFHVRNASIQFAVNFVRDVSKVLNSNLII